MRRWGIVIVVAATALLMSPWPAPAATAPKPQLAGLVHRQGPLAPSAWRSVVNAGIVTVNWSAIQSAQNGALSLGTVDSAIAQARSAGQRVKLKVYTGRYAPNWAKALDGTGFCLYDPPSTSTCHTMPKWWTPNFKVAYEDLLRKLATAYDTNPTVASVQISRCSTFFSEPFLRGATLTQNRSKLIQAGFTAAKDDVCLREQVDAQKAYWLQTRWDLALHSYQRITDSGAYAGPDQPYTRSIMEYCRVQLGTLCSLGNTGLGKEHDDSRNPDAALYADIRDMGRPVWLQTGTLEKLGGDCGDLQQAINEGVSFGAGSIELPAGYNGECERSSNLATYDRAVEANAVP